MRNLIITENITIDVVIDTAGDWFAPGGGDDTTSPTWSMCCGSSGRPISVWWMLADWLGDVAARSGLDADHLLMRFGLHWGSTVHIGNITSSARLEVTALGDEVNEAARIEACATGGKTLASKPLVERLDDRAAVELGNRSRPTDIHTALRSGNSNRKGTQRRPRSCRVLALKIVTDW